jgi:hypothetical protein
LYRFHAVIHGIKLDEEEDESKKMGKNPTKETGFFKDPKEYEHMTQEEREKLTQQMMGTMKRMATTPKRPGTYFAGIAEKQDG